MVTGSTTKESVFCSRYGQAMFASVQFLDTVWGGGYQAPYPIGDGTFKSEVQRPECEASYAPPSSAKRKHVLPKTSSWRGA
jgi:hypothetical protein